MRRGRQKRGVHAAGVCHHQGSQLLQPRFKGVHFQHRAGCSGGRDGRRILGAFGLRKICVCHSRHRADYSPVFDEPVSAGGCAHCGTAIRLGNSRNFTGTVPGWPRDPRTTLERGEDRSASRWAESSMHITGSGAGHSVSALRDISQTGRGERSRVGGLPTSGNS